MYKRQHVLSGGAAAVCAAVIVLAGRPSAAVLITPTYTQNNFTVAQRAVLAEAIKEWADLLPCSDGQRISITFFCRNLGNDANGNPILGDTLTNFNITGTPGVGTRVTSAEITVNNDALHWSLAEPTGATKPDALTVAKHEVGHGLGFIDEIEVPGTGKVKTAFGLKVKTVGGNTFYDSNGNGAYDAGTDFPLDPADPSHASSATDVMYSGLGVGERRHPTLADARVLGDAYGYCVVPEPASLFIWLLLVGSLGATHCCRRGPGTGFRP